jgi:hypothetical protein
MGTLVTKVNLGSGTPEENDLVDYMTVVANSFAETTLIPLAKIDSELSKAVEANSANLPDAEVKLSELINTSDTIKEIAVGDTYLSELPSPEFKVLNSQIDNLYMLYPLQGSPTYEKIQSSTEEASKYLCGALDKRIANLIGVNEYSLLSGEDFFVPPTKPDIAKIWTNVLESVKDVSTPELQAVIKASIKQES